MIDLQQASYIYNNLQQPTTKDWHPEIHNKIIHNKINVAIIYFMINI